MIVRENIGGGDLRDYDPHRYQSGLGYGTIGPDGDGVPHRYGYDGLFSPAIGCSTLQAALQNISNSLGAADAAGVPSDDPDYAAAQAYFNSPPLVVWTSGTCVSDTSDANALYAALTAKIKAAGSTPPTPVVAGDSGDSAPGSSNGLLDLSNLNPFSGGTPGWLIAILVIAGIGGTAWLASSVSKIYIAKKKVTS